MMSSQIAEIAVEKAAYSFDKAFDYVIPDSMLDKAVAGTRVLVPFGRGNRKRQGIITAVHQGESKGLKSVISVLDDEPVLNDEMLKTAAFMKSHYFCTFYEAVKTMLPAGINYKVTTMYGAKDESEFSFDELTDEEKRVYNYLFSKRKAVKSEVLLDAFGYSTTEPFELLVQKGVLYKSDEIFRKVNDAVMKMAAVTPEVDISGVKLTEKQKNVFELIEIAGAISVKEVCYFTGVTAAVVDALCKKGLIYFFDEEVFRIENRQKDSSLKEIVLSEEQQSACDSLCW